MYLLQVKFYYVFPCTSWFTIFPASNISFFTIHLLPSQRFYDVTPHTYTPLTYTVICRLRYPSWQALFKYLLIRPGCLDVVYGPPTLIQVSKNTQQKERRHDSQAVAIKSFILQVTHVTSTQNSLIIKCLIAMCKFSGRAR